MKSKAVSVASFISLTAALIYDCILPFMWGNDPTSTTGTLSLLCEDRKVFFWIWGILCCGSILLGLQRLIHRFDYKNKFIDALCIMSFISMLGVALTLDHSTLDWNPKRLIHWITTGLFIAFTLLPIFLFFMLNRKKYKNFTIMGLMVLLVLAAFAIIFIGVGKCALMEMIPIAMMLVLMLIANFTPILKNGDVKKAQTV